MYLLWRRAEQGSSWESNILTACGDEPCTPSLPRYCYAAYCTSHSFCRHKGLWLRWAVMVLGLEKERDIYDVILNLVVRKKCSCPENSSKIERSGGSSLWRCFTWFFYNTPRLYRRGHSIKFWSGEGMYWVYKHQYFGFMKYIGSYLQHYISVKPGCRREQKMASWKVV